MSRNATHWTQREWEALPQVQSFADLAEIALTILRRMPQPSGEVCGPISTGGKGSIEANIAEFNTTIDRLLAQGLTIFDQVPFEQHIFDLIAGGKGSRLQNELLEKFYSPLFTSGLINTLYFIPGWESSHGATWEHQQARELGINIVYL